MKPIIFFILTITAFQLSAQATKNEETIKPKKFSVGFVPQYAITGGTRIDFDINLNRQNAWLVVAPQFYLDKGSSAVYSNYREMTGAGLDLQYRYYISKKESASGAYIAAGTVFHYHSVKTDGFKTVDFKEGTSNYFTLAEQIMTTRVYKYGGNIIVGAQILAFNSFYMDAFIGTGFRLSFNNREKGLSNQFKDGWLDLGYSGTLVVGGIRFGLSFD